MIDNESYFFHLHLSLLHVESRKYQEEKKRKPNILKGKPCCEEEKKPIPNLHTNFAVKPLSLSLLSSSENFVKIQENKKENM